MSPHARRLVLATALPLLSLPLLAVPVVAQTAQTPATVSRAVDPDPTNRESMRLGWTQVLKPALETPLGWDGALDTCTPGAPSAAAQEATLTAVNYFRDVVGVEPVIFSDALSAKAQKAALIMAAQGALSHDPPADWACWTSAGEEAAGKSDLYLGRSGAAAVSGYMDDPGTGNTAVGHRRWVIDPRQTAMGSGSVKKAGGTWQQESNALYVLDTSRLPAAPAGTPEYLPWPVAGFLPLQIEPEGRWSLSSADPATDFTQATVTVDGTSNGITVRTVANGYGPHTLVWDFDPGFDAGDSDRAYAVTVSGIRKNGTPQPAYSYTVTLFDASTGAPAPAPPTVTRIGAAFAVALAGFSTSWTATDPDGVAGFQTRTRARTPAAGFGTWSEDAWSGEDGSSSLWAAQPPGTTQCESGRARDTTDTTSGWAAPACVHTPVDDTSLVRSSGWTTTTDARLWNGSATTTTEQGATLRLAGALGVDRLGIVATKCPSCGRVAVLVGGLEVGSISLERASTRRKAVVKLPRLGQALDGTVKLVVRSSGRKVQVDGLVVSQG